MLPICIKALCHPPFLNLYRIRALGLRIHQGLISKSMQYSKVDKFRKREYKIMVANSDMKHEFETLLEVIRGLVLDFVLYIVTV